MKFVIALLAIVASGINANASACNSGSFNIQTGGREDSFTGQLNFSRSAYGIERGTIAFDVYNDVRETLTNVVCTEQADGSGIINFRRTWSTGSQYYSLYVTSNSVSGSFVYYGDGDGPTTSYVVGYGSAY